MTVTRTFALSGASVAMLLASSCFALDSAKRDIRGAVLGMSLGEAVEALTRNGGVCGQGIFDTHRCDFDSDTWIHLHVAGPNKTVQGIKYVYPPMNDPNLAAQFQVKVVQLYHLSPIDKVSRYITDEGFSFTIRDGEIDYESAASPGQTAAEPKL